MSKIFKIFILTFSILFLVFILLPRQVEAQTITPAVGDLKIGESKDVTISGLTPNTRYLWVESRKQGKDYKEEYTECGTSNSSGETNITFGPFRADEVGLYKLEIYLRRSTVCQVPRLVTPVLSHDFSVGGPTGQSCCVAPFSGYDPAKDECAKLMGRYQLNPTLRQPTECSKTGDYCDPYSAQCFKTKPVVQPPPGTKKPCKKEGEPFDPTKDVKCASSKGEQCGTDPKDPAMVTAIGCIHTSPAGFVKDALKFVIGISGGLAFLMMILGVFQMLTSAGNPETLAAGKDRLTNAVIGLLFIIFATLLLKIIGVDILGIPGF